MTFVTMLLGRPFANLSTSSQKPYGVDFKAYRYSAETATFDYVPEYQLQRANSYVDP